MGRHSRRGSADGTEDAVDVQVDVQVETEAHAPSRPGVGTGRRRRGPSEAPPEPAPPSAPGRSPFSGHMSARPGAGPVRGGHPEAREPGGGWGASVPRVAGPVASARGPEHGVTAPADSALPGPRPRQERSDQGASDQGAQGRGAPGRGHPRQDYIDAFDAPAHAPAGAGFNAPVGNVSASFEASAGTDPYGRVSEWGAEPPAPPEDQDRMSAESGGGREKRGRGMTFTGIAAAAVTTVLAVVVAGQVADRDGSSAHGAQAQAAEGGRPGGGSTSRTDERPAPKKTAQAAPATYGQKMAKKYPLAADLKASGAFTTIPGDDKAPGSGQKFRYRVDVEKGLGLDGSLFAQAVQKTLNDKRSWAHDSARTFERVSSGTPDFVITLASPGTTADWCAKSGLDTTEDNVSCDSAATDRVMINAYRWAQGSKTYDDVLGDTAIHPYRQMLINHEVGHRLGFNHVTCSQDGSLAPVMQQQTKFLKSGGITCKPNPWAFPKG
ncbi:DUF3152 domain-containing protein [Streptomyces sp. NBC_00006]|uniref:DUF3152 domain-containing protein n=1 Tax=Streptomyces sp. NBC_00006 TaxID=2975619 RepID=UPI00225BA47F|nr:DUF3152 domain-containing protein [Streptomyces sp. NBC_00006]MCX5531461.1 DUF3152 domain-containing protein [Streptomyces sp. NBC_00006]